MNTDSNIHISGHHIEISPTLDQAIRDLVHGLQHKFNHITKSNIHLKIDNSTHKQMQIAEAEIHVCGTKEPIFAKSSSDNMYDSLNKLKDKLSRQIVKHKEHLKDHGDHSHHNHDHHNNINDNLDNNI